MLKKGLEEFAFSGGGWKALFMRGRAVPQVSMVLMLSTGDELIPAGHPIRRIRAVVDEVLAGLEPEFDRMYAVKGRPSVPPEQLLKACVLMGLYTIRSERQFCERLQYDMLFKWFMDMPINAAAFDPSTFSKNKDRLLEHDIAERFFAVVVGLARLRDYVSSDHFSVDGTLLEAWASDKSFQPKPSEDPPDGPPTAAPLAESQGRNPDVNFHGQKRSNVTHESTTDPEARLFRKSANTAAKLCFAGHTVIENRNGLIVEMELTIADGYAERDAAIVMLKRLPKSGRRRTVAADKGYDTKGFVQESRAAGFTPHVAQNLNRTRGGSAIDRRTTRHPGYAISQRKRKRVEEPFGWIKTIGGGRKLRHRGRERNRHWWLLTGAVCNIVRITNLDIAS